MKKYTLFGLVFILFVTLFSFNVNSVSAASTSGVNVSGCLAGDMFSRTTGQACGTISAAVTCSTGDVFSSLSGQRCTAWQDNSNSSDLTQFRSLFQSWFKVGVNNTSIKPLQQFLKDQGYYFGKIDGKYGKITDRAVKDFQDDNSLAGTTTTATATVINSAPVLNSIQPNSGPVGTQVIINGTGFSPNDNTVNGHGPAGDFQVHISHSDGKTIPFTVPVMLANTLWTGQPVTPGVYSIQVGSMGGSSNNLNFTVTNPTCPAGSFDSTTGFRCGCTSISGFSSVDGTSCGPTNQALTITNASTLPNAKVGVNYFMNLSATGGSVFKHIWKLNQGSTPPGLTFSHSIPECANSNPNSLNCIPSGVLSGTPTLTGTYTFIVQVTSDSLITTKQFTLTVEPATCSAGGFDSTTGFRCGCTSISGFSSVDGTSCGPTNQALTIITPSVLPNAILGFPYSTSVVASGVQAPFTWSTLSGSLPPGIIRQSGDDFGMVGTPTTVGTYSFTLQISSNSQTTSKQFTLTVDPASTIPVVTSITNSSLPNAKVGSGYTAILTVLPSSISTNQLYWSVIRGSLPEGLAFSASDLGAIITGTPSIAGAYIFTLQASPSSSSAGSVSKQFVLTVDSATTAPITPTTVNGVCGSATASQLNASIIEKTSLCSTGNPGTLTGESTSSNVWTWSCAGLNGGTTASCSVLKTNISSTVPVCGSSHYATNGVLNGKTFTSAPTTGLCDVGTASAVGPDSGGWYWQCTLNSTSYTCHADRTASATATCGLLNNAVFATKPTTTSMNLCNNGTPGSITGAGPYSWICTGTNGIPVSCNSVVANSTACGTAYGVSSATAPTSNLCGTGYIVKYSPEQSASSWMWACYKSGTATYYTCTSPSTAPNTTITSAACGSLNGISATIMDITLGRASQCSKGAASGISGSGPWTWTCTGSDGAIVSCNVSVNNILDPVNIVQKTVFDPINTVGDAINSAGNWIADRFGW